MCPTLLASPKFHQRGVIQLYVIRRSSLATCEYLLRNPWRLERTKSNTAFTFNKSGRNFFENKWLHFAAEISFLASHYFGSACLFLKEEDGNCTINNELLFLLSFTLLFVYKWRINIFALSVSWFLWLLNLDYIFTTIKNGSCYHNSFFKSIILFKGIWVFTFFYLT
jgi:hypothetical protein